MSINASKEFFRIVIFGIIDPLTSATNVILGGPYKSFDSFKVSAGKEVEIAVCTNVLLNDLELRLALFTEKTMVISSLLLKKLEKKILNKKKNFFSI